MGYKNFQVPKEVYLPITPNDDLTCDQYKEKYGIDIKQFIEIREGDIVVNSPSFTKLYIVLCQHDEGFNFGGERKVVTELESITESAYISGSSDGATVLGSYSNVESAFGGIALCIDKSNDLLIDNVHIRPRIF